MIISIIFYTFLGWLVALVINHAADILPLRQTLRQWPSCPVCATPRPWPAWSALATVWGGRQTCAGCGQRRPTMLRAALVEMIMPTCFIFLLFRYDGSLRLPLLVLYSAILLLITVTDLEHRLIFNSVMLPAIVLALVAAFFTPGMVWPIALVGGAVGFVLSYVAALVSRGGLGSGDVTLSAFLGLILGFPHILLSLFFGVFLGGMVALLLLLSRRVGLKSYIPYGPFLTSTGWIMLVWGDAIWRYYFAR